MSMFKFVTADFTPAPDFGARHTYTYHYGPARLPRGKRATTAVHIEAWTRLNLGHGVYDVIDADPCGDGILLAPVGTVGTVIIRPLGDVLRELRSAHPGVTFTVDASLTDDTTDTYTNTETTMTTPTTETAAPTTTTLLGDAEPTLGRVPAWLTLAAISAALTAGTITKRHAVKAQSVVGRDGTRTREVEPSVGQTERAEALLGRSGVVLVQFFDALGDEHVEVLPAPKGYGYSDVRVVA